MDTVVKTMIEEDEEPDKRKLVIFGRDVSQIPCFKDSYINGILTGIGVGVVAFIKTSKPMLSSHIGMASFTVTTLSYFTYCRYRWSQQLRDAAFMQEALKEKLRIEGTDVERQLESKGVLKTV